VCYLDVCLFGYKKQLAVKKGAKIDIYVKIAKLLD